MQQNGSRSCGQCGMSLIESLVATAVVGLMAVIIAGGVGLMSHASFTADQKTTAESLAAGQMEFVKSQTYVYGATTYAAAGLPPGKDYLNYSVTIAAASLRTPDDGIQKITVNVQYSGTTIDSLVGYKLAP